MLVLSVLSCPDLTIMTIDHYVHHDHHDQHDHYDHGDNDDHGNNDDHGDQEAYLIFVTNPTNMFV